MKNNLALFDVDGTLVILWEIHDRAYKLTIRELYGVEASLFDSYTPGKTPPEIVADILKTKGLSEDAIKSRIEEVPQTMEKHFLDSLNYGKITILPGIQQIVENLYLNNVLMGMVSGNSKNVTDTIIKKINFDKYFRVRAYGHEASNRVDVLKLAVNRSEELTGSKYKKDEIYVLDDSILGIDAANALKLRSIAVATGPYTYEELQKHKPNYLFKDFSNYKEVLRILLSR